MLLAAFIFNILSSVVSLISILISAIGFASGAYNVFNISGSAITLIIGILMSVFSYQIYKGTRKNTIAIGVIDLIFGNLISGILLLIDYGEKEKKNKNESNEVEVIDINEKDIK